MRSISSGLAAHLEEQVTTLARCLRVQLANGTVYGFTDHDRPLVVSGQTYSPVAVSTPTDVATTSNLSVDALDVGGDNSIVTEEDLHAGLWDYAEFSLFVVNWSDLTQGTMILRTGRLGEVTMRRGEFQTELRGLTQAYAMTIGSLVTPACRAVLGDSRCGVSMGAYTVTGTVDSVSADSLVIYDSARTEAGPTGAITINDVDNDSPATVHLDDTFEFPVGTPVTISGISTMPGMNATTYVTEVGSTKLIIRVEIDASAMPTYSAGGGSVTPLGSDSGYFDYGLLTMTSGASEGLSMEVKSYVPGQITLQLPFPFTVAAGDTYSLTAGCDRSFATCRDRFNNVVNFRGEPYVPGLDSLVQVGRSQ